MALVHTGVGIQLAKGMFDTGNGVEGQDGSKTAGGSLKPYRNKNGEIDTLYAVDADEFDVTFTGLMKKTGYTAKDKGDPITITGVTLPTVTGCTPTLLVEEWREMWQNDEVVKVQGKAHCYIVKNTTPDPEPSES